MFGILAICYLFFGGAGAGALLVASMVDLLWAREPFGAAVEPSAESLSPLRRLLAFAFLAGLVFVTFGALCLVFDLGRIDRLSALFLSPSATFLTVGAFSLAALVVCGAFLSLVRFCSLPAVSRGLVVAVEVATIVLASVVMVYTGLLLQGLGAVALWKTPLVPMLFTLSSLSSGCALAFVCALGAEAETEGAAFQAVRALAIADVVLIVVEAGCAVAFALGALESAHPGAAASAAALFGGGASGGKGAAGVVGAGGGIAGTLPLVWWVGFVGCGLVVPFVLEAVTVGARARDRHRRLATLAVAAAFVFIGAFCLRFGIVDAGEHRSLALEDAPAIENQEPSTLLERAAGAGAAAAPVLAAPLPAAVVPTFAAAASAPAAPLLPSAPVPAAPLPAVAVESPAPAFTPAAPLAFTPATSPDKS